VYAKREHFRCELEYIKSFQTISVQELKEKIEMNIPLQHFEPTILKTKQETKITKQLHSIQEQLSTLKNGKKQKKMYTP
jgi:hypothetical protein